MSGRPSRSRAVGAAMAVAVLATACTTGDPGSTADDAATSTTDAPVADAPASLDPAEPATPPSAVVGLMILAPVPTMTLTAGGFRDSVAACDTVDIEVVERDAAGDLEALAPLAQELLDRPVDLIATVATPTAQAAHEVVGDVGGTTPVVFATVTDPFSAGLARDPGTHEPWITGSASPPPVAAVIDAAAEIVPDLDVVGVVRNPSEANSRFTVDAVQAEARGRGIGVEIVDIEDSTEVREATEALIDLSVGALVVPTDTTVYAGLEEMSDVAADNDVLVIGTDPNQAFSGAAIALGSDYYGSGFRAGGIACRVLGGEATPADFDVVDIESLGITVNDAAAEAQGVTIPEALRELAEAVE